MTLAEDLISELPIFFDTDEFAVEGVLGDGSKIRGIFDRSYIDTLGVEDATPTFTIKDSDAVTLVHGTQLTIEGVVYFIKEIHPQGSITVLELRK
jgi:hypothetical protein